MKPRYLFFLLLIGNTVAVMADGTAQTSTHGTGVSGLRQYSVQANKPLNYLNVNLYSPAEEKIKLPGGAEATEFPAGPSVVNLMLTDPQGRRTGIDKTGEYNEIPHSSYIAQRLEDDSTGQTGSHTSKLLDITSPTEGVYTARVTGTAKGTYDLAFIRLPADRHTTRVSHISIAPGEVHVYRVHYSAEKSIPLRIERLASK